MHLEPLTVQLLARRLHTFCFGHAHSSNDLHLGVIERVGRGFGSSELERMRQAAVDAAVALETRDLDSYGAALSTNHECIRRLDPRLVSAEADSVVQLAQRYGARGWKVNGAGGDGGSMVVLGPDDDAADAALVEALRAVPGGRLITGAIDEVGVQLHQVAG
jgi:D-glycero-alpha-D-manno-heptose-7-phosphate kinase